MKTQSQLEYLTECFTYHQRRYSEEYEKDQEKVKYHLNQCRWFLRKLDYIRFNPTGTISRQSPLGQFTPAPIDFDKPFRESIAAAESLPRSEEPVIKKPRYPLDETNYVNFETTQEEMFKEYFKLVEIEHPKPTFFSRLWNVFKRK